MIFDRMPLNIAQIESAELLSKKQTSSGRLLKDFCMETLHTYGDHETRIPPTVRLGGLENAYSHPLFSASNFDQ